MKIFTLFKEKKKILPDNMIPRHVRIPLTDQDDRFFSREEIIALRDSGAFSRSFLSQIATESMAQDKGIKSHGTVSVDNLSIQKNKNEDTADYRACKITLQVASSGKPVDGLEDCRWADIEKLKTTGVFSAGFTQAAKRLVEQTDLLSKPRYPVFFCPKEAVKKKTFKNALTVQVTKRIRYDG